MKTRYTANKQLGSYTNFDESPEEMFKLPEVKSIIDNNTNEVIFEREHIFIGYILTGIRMIGKIKVYKCSDTGIKITNIGNLLDEEMERFSAIEKNRKSETVFVNSKLELSWSDRFKIVKKEFNLTNLDFANMAEVTEGNVKNITKPSKDFPNLLKPSIVILEDQTKKVDK